MLTPDATTALRVLPLCDLSCMTKQTPLFRPCGSHHQETAEGINSRNVVNPNFLNQSFSLFIVTQVKNFVDPSPVTTKILLYALRGP